MKKTIEITVKNVYGVERIYPISEDAKLLCSLTGRKTFQSSDLEIIKNLGYDIEQINNNTITV